MSVILSDLAAKLRAMTGSPISGRYKCDVEAVKAAMSAIPDLLALAKAALEWRSTMDDAWGSKAAQAAQDAMLEALSRIHP